MGLITVSGSLKPTSTPPDEVKNKYVDTNVQVDQEPTTDVMPAGVPSNTFNVDGLVKHSWFPELTAAFARYTKGTIIEVIYYHINKAVVDRITESQGAVTGTHNSYLRINSFELKVDSEFSYEYNVDDVTSALSGSCIIFPGFTPRVGDFFVYQIDPNKWGCFKITSVERLSIHNQTCHTVNIQLIEFVDGAKLDEYEQNVSDVAYYISESYLTGKTVYIQSDEKAIYNDAITLLAQLKSEYIKMFYTSRYNSFRRPDDVYDPYIIDYIKQVFSLIENNLSILQVDKLYSTETDSSIVDYYTYIQHYADYSISDVGIYYKVQQYQPAPRNVRMTPLILDNTLRLTTSSDDTAYSTFGLQDQVNWVTDLDTLMGTYFLNQTIDPVLLFKVVTERTALTALEKFYQVPLFIFLLNKLQMAIKSGAYRSLFNITKSTEPATYPFNADQLTDGWLTVTISNVNILGTEDENGVQYVFADGEVIYNTDTIQLNIGALLARLSLTMSGIWKIRLQSTG